MPCLSQCYNKNENCIKKPINSEGLAPYVKIFFPPINGEASAAGNVICTTIDKNPKPPLTVGNDSNTPFNFAVIKSFQYGASDGNGAEMEIYDEEGGSLDLFINKLVKVLPDATNYGCSVEWGWIATSCNGGQPCVIKSSQHFFNILSIVINYASGGVTFKVSLEDLVEPLFETRTRADITATLKEAIRQVFRETVPPINSILFLSSQSAQTIGFMPGCSNLVSDNDRNQTQVLGSCFGGLPPQIPTQDTLKFLGATETKVATYPCKGMNPLAAVRQWLSTALTQNNPPRGTVIFWNSISPVPQLVIMEDPFPPNWNDLNSKEINTSIGTYIVNGGSQSPVISFDPQIKFTFATAANAGSGQDPQSASAVNPTPSNDKPCQDPPGSGDTTNITIPQYLIDVWGNQAKDIVSRALTANERANKLYENIEAELRIQGDPSLDNPWTIKTKTVSLWVINPFHLLTFDKSKCPAWTYLPGSPCNSLMTNKNWGIKGVSHDIKEGSYTTTLRIYLPAPCQDIPF